MLDVYYGYDDDGIVRTNLAGGVDRKKLEKERGKDAVRRARPDGRAHRHRGHVGQEAGPLLLPRLLRARRGEGVGRLQRRSKDFLDRNLTEVVILDFEDYVQPKDLQQALDDAGPRPPPAHARPGQAAHDDDARPRHSRSTRRTRTNPRRLIVVSEKHGGQEKFLPKTYSPVPGDAVHVHVDQRLQLQAEPGRHEQAAAARSTTGSGPTVRPTRPRRARSTRRRCSTKRFKQCIDAAQEAAERDRGRLHRDRRPLPERQPVQRRGRDGHRGRRRRWTKVIRHHRNSRGPHRRPQLARAAAAIRRLPKISEKRRASSCSARSPTSSSPPHRASPKFEKFNGLEPDDADCHDHDDDRRPAPRAGPVARRAVTMRGMTEQQDVETVERVIAAPPEAIFAFLVDPPKHREIDGSGTVRDAKGEPQTARARQHVRHVDEDGPAVLDGQHGHRVRREPPHRVADPRPDAASASTSAAGSGATSSSRSTAARWCSESWDIRQESGATRPLVRKSADEDPQGHGRDPRAHRRPRHQLSSRARSACHSSGSASSTARISSP